MDGHKIYRSRDRDRNSEDMNVDIKRWRDRESDRQKQAKRFMDIQTDKKVEEVFFEQRSRKTNRQIRYLVHLIMKLC